MTTPIEFAAAIRSVGLGCFPCWARYNPDKKRYDKGLRIPQGEDWRMTAHRPVTDPQLDWSSGVVGVPVPEGVVVFDLDEYKGVTRQDVEAALGGAALDWDRAMIQRTISGGAHYAFRTTWPVRQIQGTLLPGFDTRAAGQGFICAGVGYSATGYGVFALGVPQSLPYLPDACRPVLGVVDRSSPAALPDSGGRNTDEVEAALRHIDPGCPRGKWLRVGLALKNLFHDDDDTGHLLFDRWSRGDLWLGTPPSNYVPDHIPHQWASFKPSGGIGAKTLWWEAIQAGWRPPRTFNVADAFGAGAASMDQFGALLARVLEHGADPAAGQDILEGITGSPCNSLQRELLLAVYQRELQDAGLLTKALRAKIERLTGEASGARPGAELPTAGQVLPSHVPLHPDAWAAYHTKGKDRKPRGTWDNFDIMLRAYGVVISYDEVAKEVRTDGPSVPGGGTLHDEAVISYVDHLANLNDYPKADARSMLLIAANRNIRNPVREYVYSRPWDGYDHVGALFAQLTLHPDEVPAFAEVLFRKWLRGALAIGTGVTRRFEFVLVFVDPEGGAGKTRFFSTLCPEPLRKDSVILDTSDKDSVKVATSYWLVELGELDGTFSKSESHRLKSFLSAEDDQIRLPYGRAYLKYPRRTAFVGSVNRETFLIDDSENRRFWPIRVLRANHQHAIDVQQVWAQAAAEVAMGQQWYLTDRERAMLNDRNEAHRAQSAVGDAIELTFGRVPEDPDAPVEFMPLLDIMRASGISRPTKAELNEGAEWLRRAGYRRIKLNGVRGYRMPPRKEPAGMAAAFKPALVKP